MRRLWQLNGEAKQSFNFSFGVDKYGGGSGCLPPILKKFMTREERKEFTRKNREFKKLCQKIDREEKKAWNWMVRKAKAKGAWIDQNDYSN